MGSVKDSDLLAIHEKRLPALSRRLKAGEESYADLAAALLEAAAERREADRWKIYAEDELLAAAGMEAVDAALAE